MSNPLHVGQTRLYASLVAGEDAAEGAWLTQQINEFWNDTRCEEFECTDNFSLSRVGDAEEEAAANEIASWRCCGMFSTQWGPSPSGHTYTYAFDYGH